ncbi:MAG TPA: nicotinate (nicotinamide) nucleotide adenylyltransferase [Eoetvoesiella sp.]
MAIKKIGLLGGSFDPVHLAHIALADTACQELKLETVELIPAANPWQRKPLSASPQHRIAMLKLAIARKPNLRLNPVEIERGGKTYTIDTLKELPPGVQYYWILGADQLGNFCSWHYWEDIAARVHLVVAQRPGTDVAVPDPLQQHLTALNRPLIHLPFEPMPISASDIRHRLASGQVVDGLLDPAVAQYIQRNNLYQTPFS